MAQKEFLPELLQLPEEERARLAHELIRSLDGEADPDAAALWDTEIERRAAEVRDGTVESLSEEEFRERLRRLTAARAKR